MQRVRFRDPAGSVRRGAWEDGTVTFADRAYDAGAVDVLPPCDPTKLVCVGLNYVDHAAEGGSEVPDRPRLFLKGPNALAGHGDAIPLLAGTERIEYEAELGVVIGEQCRHVDAGEAMDVVAGYTAGMDLSNRVDQRRDGTLVRGKAFDGASPIGPTLATPDEVPGDARIRLRHNGETRQDSSIDQLIFPVPELIEEITAYLTLEPGDVILTGTPEGPGALEAGDRVEVDVEGIPTLAFTVTDP